MGLRRIAGKLEEASVAGLVALIIAIFVPILFRNFRDRLGHYPQQDLWGAIAIYVVTVGLDLTIAHFLDDSAARNPVALVSLFIYSMTALFFVIGTYVQDLPARGQSSPAPIYLSLMLLGIGLLVRTRLNNHSTVVAKESGGTGLATTSVLIVPASGPASFMLILNRNLNNGKGLWVPPGGHFELGVDDPADRLLQKIRSEVGIEAKIWNPAAPSAELSYTFNTAQTKWLEAPIFILDEDLLGLCSHGHARHFDLIYACEAIGYVPHAVAKYSLADRALVPLNDCASSVEAAETAVYAAIEHWQRTTVGTTPGVRDTVSRDVAQRLHLVALKYAEQLTGRRQTAAPEASQ
jgi:hypothetical protein